MLFGISLILSPRGPAVTQSPSVWVSSVWMADKPYRWIVFRTGLSEDSGRSRLQMPRFRLGPQPVIVGIPKSSELCSSYRLNLIRRIFYRSGWLYFRAIAFGRWFCRGPGSISCWRWPRNSIKTYLWSRHSVTGT